MSQGERWRPFSHRPGTRCWIPYSEWVVEIFPAMLQVGDHSFPLHLTGPVKEFTVQLDLEKDCVWVWGIAKEGHYRFSLRAEGGSLVLLVDRAPKEGLQIGGALLKSKESLPLTKGPSFRLEPSLERLSLGSWKAQEVERMDLCLIAPILFLIGQKVAAEALPLDVPLEHFVLTSLSGLFVPHDGDPLHQGVAPPTKQTTPFALLKGAYLLIRSFLLAESSDELQILPRLPADWETGKVFHLQAEKGEIDFEWSQGSPHRLYFRPTQSGEVCFSFPSNIRTFRCGSKRLENRTPLKVEKGCSIVLDRFQQ